jgi:ferredoxin
MSIVALDATEAVPTGNGVTERLQLTVHDNDMPAVSQAAKSCGGGGSCDTCDTVPCGPVYCSHC